MSVSNRDLIGFFWQLEKALQASEPDVADYLPVIRSYVYFSQRQTFSPRILTRANFSRPGELFGSVRSMLHVLRARFSNIRGTQLFVAPARHRNTLIDGDYVSKHLDSLVREYGGRQDLVWESGPAPNASVAADSLPQHVFRLTTILSRLLYLPAKIRRIREIIRGAIAQNPVEIDFDLAGLVYHLYAYDLSRAYYKSIFRRSRLTRAYFVVFYSFRHAPIISALNEMGILTIEYQHGIQNNIHPLYTHWEDLETLPSSLPARVLVWDEVSEKRISAWARKLGISTEVVGNLWCSRSSYPGGAGAQGSAIMVAVQLLPGNFNYEILKVMEKTPERHWIFREHPVYPIDDQNRKMLLENYPNLEIVSVRHESVEDTLARSVCCITGFSTVGIEALLFGRKTIFTHENARDGLADYIDGERCFYADTAQDILSIVQRC